VGVRTCGLGLLRSPIAFTTSPTTPPASTPPAKRRPLSNGCVFFDCSDLFLVFSRCKELTLFRNFDLNQIKIEQKMFVEFDLQNKRATFEHNNQRISANVSLTVTAQWIAAFASGISIDDESYSVAWKTWQREKQFVEVSKYNEENHVSQRIIASWSYIARPECPIEHCGLQGSVRVIGSPYGDWCN
tara:strand:+ start:5187 stop:5747 length:561 start_codon:yes stop_codon:yes gene_type:complete